MTEDDFAHWADQFRLPPDQMLAGVLGDYAEVAVGPTGWSSTCPTCPTCTPRPVAEAPWFPPGDTGRPAGSSCTSSPRPPSTPSSFANPSTAKDCWASEPTGVWREGCRDARETARGDEWEKR